LVALARKRAIRKASEFELTGEAGTILVFAAIAASPREIRFFGLPGEFGIIIGSPREE